MNKSVPAGHSVTLECTIPPHPVPEKVQWFRNEIEIANSPTYEIAYHNGLCCLTIAHTTPEISGTFTCIITIRGITNSTEMYLEVGGEVLKLS